MKPVSCANSVEFLSWKSNLARRLTLLERTEFTAAIAMILSLPADVMAVARFSVLVSNYASQKNTYFQIPRWMSQEQLRPDTRAKSSDLGRGTDYGDKGWWTKTSLESLFWRNWRHCGILFTAAIRICFPLHDANNTFAEGIENFLNKRFF